MSLQNFTKKSGCGFLLLSLLFLSSTAWATDYYVSTSGDNANDCLSPSSACLTVQGAISKTSSGDTINIAAGTYTNANSITVSNQSLSFVGAGAGTTVLDGNNSVVVFNLSSNLPDAFAPTVSISNLSIQNGNSNNGGGIRLSCDSFTFASMNLNLTNLWIHDNTTSSKGGGLVLNDCIKSTFNVSNTSFSSNSSQDNGGALYIVSGNGGNPTLNLGNVTFYQNTVAMGEGGAISIFDFTDVNVNNVTIASNSSSGPDASAFDFGGPSNLIAIQNTVFDDNTGGNCPFMIMTPPTSLGYNISSDSTCTFLNQTGDLDNTDPLLGTFDTVSFTNVPTVTLLEGSPAINAGNNSTCESTDARGVTRPQGPACDMGAYEANLGTLEASPSSLNFTDSSTENVSLSITGVVPIIITDVQISGTDAASFTYDSTDCVGTLSPGTPCTISKVQLTATENGSYTASIDIIDSTGSIALQIPLTGSIGGETSPSLSLVITGPTPELTSSLNLGSTVIYTVKAENKGTGDAPDSSLTLSLPPSVSYGSITAVQNLAAIGSDFDFASSYSCSYASSVVSCGLGTLSAGSSVTFELTTTLVASGSLELTGTLSSGSDTTSTIGSEGVTFSESDVTGGCSLSAHQPVHNPLLYEMILVLLLATFYFKKLAFSRKKKPFVFLQKYFVPQKKRSKIK